MKQNPLMYAIIGDICGSRYERIVGRHLDVPAINLSNLMHDDCHFTDDTVHTIAVAHAILDNYENPNFEYFIKKYTKEYPNAGYGKRFLDWVSGVGPNDSFGNGCYMRLSPILVAYLDVIQQFSIACKSIAVSHNHPQSYKYLPIFVPVGYDEQGYVDDLVYQKIDSESGYKKTLKEYAKKYKFDATCDGSIPEAIFIAWNCKSYEECIKDAIFLGGDTDTQACIAGYFYGINTYNYDTNEYEEIPQDLYDWAWNKLPEEFHYILNKFQELLDKNADIESSTL